jgi:hypothetical protein
MVLTTHPYLHLYVIKVIEDWKKQDIKGINVSWNTTVSTFLYADAVRESEEQLWWAAVSLYEVSLNVAWLFQLQKQNLLWRGKKYHFWRL